MKITKFEVTNYRSIAKKSTLPLGDLTVLIGPNNAGKSNLLRALVTAARILAGGHFYVFSRRGGLRSVRYRYREADNYEWQRDYPVALQSEKPEGTSDFLLSFELNHQEARDFHTATGTRLTGNLTLKLKLGRESANIEVSMRGPAKKQLNQRRSEIATFIREHFDYQYIPSVRSSELSEELVERMVAGELAGLETDTAYSSLLDQLRNLQRPILDQLGQNLTETVRAFLPEVKQIHIENQEGLLRAVRRSSEILVNDGDVTGLSSKGDGIQSLVAIALMRHVAQRGAGAKSLLLAIEEPEAHLHPDAVHRLRKVIEETSTSFQVILTTHSPLMVERARPTRNIIVRSASAKPAKSLAEIRDCLGVRLADNLSSAFLVLLVEGNPDEKILRAWLPHLQPDLAPHIRNGTLAFDHLNGANNLSYKASFYKKAALCNCHALLDGDEAGRNAIQRATADGTLEASEVHIASCPGLRDSEIEDLVDHDAYRTEIEQQFSVNLGVPEFRNAQAKWSDRLSATFGSQGRVWDRHIESRCKGIVAGSVEKNRAGSLHPAKRSSIEAAALALLERIQGRD